MNNLYDVIIQFIEDSKTKYNISYDSTIEFLKQLINEIEKEYQDLKEV